MAELVILTGHVAVVATWKRLAPPDPAEGFNALYRVRLRPDGGYDVAPIETAEAPPEGGSFRGSR